MKAEHIAYTADGARMVGYLVVDADASARRPGVLIAPEALGLTDHTRRIAGRLAALGFVAFAADYYGDGRIYHDVAEARPVAAAFHAAPDGLRERMAAALAVLEAQPQTDPERMAAIGYCFGGTAVLELARAGADLKAVVGFHSGLTTVRPQDARNIRGRILVCIGAADPVVPLAQRLAFEQEMMGAGVDWRLEVHGMAAHSFTNPDAAAMNRPGVAYNGRADERTWRSMRDLFSEVFGMNEGR